MSKLRVRRAEEGAKADASPWLAGFIAELPTPFDTGGAVDLSGLRWLCERQIQSGATSIVIGEISGEAPTLGRAEHELLVRAALDVVGGRIAVVAGASSNSTREAVRLAQQAEAAGADAILSVVPYYNKPTQAGIEAHFRSIADSISLPIVLHDAPGRTVREMADDTIARLAESPQFVGLKDSTFDLLRPARLRALINRDFRLLSGHDATASTCMLQGGQGCISVMANVAPNLCRTMYHAIGHGDLTSATQLSDRLRPLANILNADCGVAPLKYALSLSGKMSSRVRLPLVEPCPASKQRIAAVVASLRSEAAPEFQF